MATVTFRDVVKTFSGHVTVIHGVNLEVKDGEFVVFVGPSGCGKSTMLRLIAGLEMLTDGEILIGDKVVNHIVASKRGIAMVFQSYALYPHMDVYENMSFALRLAKRPKAEIDAAVKRAAEILQITDLLNRKPKALSGGQRQRVAIGRAIVRKPQVFLFDEPLSNLDAALRVQMRVELAKLRKELKTTMIYVTHDQVEAMTLGDRVIVFSNGRIEQAGNPIDLYHEPNNIFVAGFLGSPRMNFIPCKLLSKDAKSVTVGLTDGASMVLPMDGSKLSAGDRLSLGIRPEHISILKDIRKDGLVAVVDLMEHLGDAQLAYVYVEIPGHPDAISIKLGSDAEVMKPGERIGLGISPKNCHLFDAEGAALTRLG